MNLKKFSFLAVLFFISSSSFAVDCMIEPDALLPKQLIPHGAPVQSVAWCCNPLFSDPKYAAIGGYLGTGDTYVRVYNFDRTLSNPLVEKTSLPNPTVDFSPQADVLSVDWCCQLDGTDPLLAVGCLDGMVHVYSYTGYPVREHLVYQSTFTHELNVPINTVSWLCNCYDDNFLAIGGETASDKREIRILRFDSSLPPAERLTEVGSGIHGNTVFSLHWCCIPSPDATDPYLAVGGKPSALGGSECSGPNLRIFCFLFPGAGEGVFNPIISMKVPSEVSPPDLHAVRWCCEDSIKYPKLAVGGKKGDDEKNMWLYYLVNNRLIKVASTVAQETIFAIDWNPSPCKCSHLTLGGGCKTDPICEHNIFVFKQDKCELSEVFSTRYDDNVTSLRWCGDNGKSYLLVGTENDNWNNENVCQDDVNSEAVLYVAAFCQPQSLPVCLRTLW